MTAIKMELDQASRRQLEQALKQLEASVILDAVKPEMKAGALEFKRDMKDNLSTMGIDESGSLRKEIKLGRFYVRNQKTLAWHCVGIGYGEYEYRGKIRRPSRYAHLVEFGFHHVKHGMIAPRPFARAAWESNAAAIRDDLLTAAGRAIGV